MIACSAALLAISSCPAVMSVVAVKSLISAYFASFDFSKCTIQIKTYFQKQLKDVLILGPANRLIYRMHDIYRKRIFIKFTNSKTLYPVLFKLNDFYNRAGYKVNVVCDFNPYNQI